MAMKLLSKRLISLLSGMFICAAGIGQLSYVKLPANVNHPGLKGRAPLIGLEGNALLFLSNYSDDGSPNLFYSSKGTTGWKDPVALPRHLNQKLNFTPGFGLSPDGKQVFVSNNRSSGFGGYDLYVSDLRGATWAELQNVGMAINSKLNEACPSLTLDGNTLFFMRCAQIDAASGKADGCKLFMAKRRTADLWETAVELPAFINTGNSQTPRILGDSETLIFSSALFGGKGGMEWLLTRFDGKNWSPPILLDFANTEGDDQYGSATALGRYWLCDRAVKGGTEMAEILFPPSLKPKATLRVEGRVEGVSNGSPPYVYATNLAAPQVYRTRPAADGTFRLFLPEGARYDVSVEPLLDSYTFFSTQYDLTTGKMPILERIEARLLPVATGVELDLKGIALDAAGQVSPQLSREEFRRLERLLKGNRDKKFVLDVELYGYRRDSVASDPDLTEVATDTAHVVPAGSNPQTFYHNDRSVEQGLEVINLLLARGISGDQVKLRARAVPGEARPARTRFRLITQ
jgi:hypothetical protein